MNNEEIDWDQPPPIDECPLCKTVIFAAVAAALINVNDPPTCSIAIKFSGSKTPGNNLSFPSGDQTLGLKNLSDRWIWQVEIGGSVSDNAASWSLKQSYTGRRKRVLQQSNGTLRPETDVNLNVPDDDPESPARQQPSGQSVFFWIDGPGHLKSVFGENTYSLTQVQNFTSWAQKGSASCSVQWHLKLVVDPGGVLNTTQTQAGLGHISTNF